MPKILVIDDDAAIRIAVTRVLQYAGHEVVVVADGQEGIETAKQIQPALIICDWMMPGIDGLEVCRRVKADPNLTTTFFILLTSRIAVEDRIKGLNTGADDFLSKPVDFGELQARVRAGLRLYQLNQDLHLQKQLLEAELAEAAAYVRSLLPVPLSGEIQIEAHFIPSSQLGGDCFDYFWLDDDHLVLYLLDVSGHGLGAALPSVLLLNSLRSQSLPEVDFRHPEAVLTALNRSFQMSSQNEKFFTIWYGVYQPSQRRLTYASAGHPPAILISPIESESIDSEQTNVQELRTPSLPIGMLEDLMFSDASVIIPPDSVLYIYSDGAYELSDIAQDWGLNEFVQMLVELGRSATLDQVLSAVKSHCSTQKLSDDLSLLKAWFD
ncbi:MAG TPA: SpoIIE family protein phosphatase [Trichocoleus sp.]|jgi:sigma-B regulation protein RsbU (phosphoserine phosphatase)